ncbi:hypothetical protein QR77_16560 [Streptomyces sp. 150FB]|nr:hypothetical protein QR77_16560 [Streptomyces sp. 150FB]
MDTMCVDATTIRSAATVADARETTRASPEAVWQPATGSTSTPRVNSTALVRATIALKSTLCSTSAISSAHGPNLVGTPQLR